ncbi:MAG: hypothetical protein LBG96_13995 [Tannerella sp.]|jgi:signal transduction histidine kinase|nr:hypothetical protein [Tannerella sp.]
MKRESLDNNTEKKRFSVRLSKNELLKDVPPAAILSLNGISSYYIENEADVVRFTKGLEVNDAWMEDQPDDENTSLNILLSDGLIVAVKNYCDSLSNVYFESFGIENEIEKKLKIILYRSVCELVNNAMKYACASNIFVQVIAEDGFISVTVYDDGKGFDPETVTIGTGLGNIAQAAIANKGKMKIHSSSKGVEINIEIEQRI